MPESSRRPTSNDKFSSSIRSKRLCRYIASNDQTPSLSYWIASPNKSNNNATSPFYAISLGDFEDVMEKSLDDSIQPLHYINRDDFVWLNCRRPLYPIESILGLEEESETPSSFGSISIATYRVLLDEKKKEEEYLKSCDPIGDGPPGTIWPEVHRRSLAMGSASRSKGFKTLRSAEEDSSIVMEWLDCRSLKSNFDFSSMASCAYFLRSLLDVGHDASPWVTKAKENDRTSSPSTATSGRDDSGTVDCRDSKEKNIVILIVARQALPEKLIQFRVSDACPSWFLHAVGHVKNVNGKAMPWLREAKVACSQTNDENICSNTNGSLETTRDAEIENSDDDDDEAAIIIYRRLPPRVGLYERHPKSQEPVNMKGCLWEKSYVVKEEGAAPEVTYHIVGPPILDPLEEYPNLLEPLLSQDSIFDAMRQEALQIAHWTAWPEQQHYKATSETGEAPWNVFPLCHTFPAHDLAKRKWVPATCAMVPQTVAALQTTLGDTLRTALFSRLDPESVLEAHTGWADLANHVLRVHIPLVVPSGNLCGVWVDGCVQLHRLGQALCFDDSKTHRAFNYSKEPRIVLILDLVRPATLPLGTATGGHSDELDEFIGKMGVAR